jgi:hypothetical protein
MVETVFQIHFPFLMARIGKDDIKQMKSLVGFQDTLDVATQTDVFKLGWTTNQWPNETMSKLSWTLRVYRSIKLIDIT